MAATKYTYSISNDTDNSKVAVDALVKEIHDSTIIISVDHINTANDVLDIWMKDVLSANAQTTLTVIVANHQGIPIAPKPQTVIIQEEQEPTGGHYQAESYEIDVDATTGWKETTFSYPHPISILSASWNNQASFDGDEIEFLVGEHTIIGAITSDVAIDDDVISVQQSVIDNIVVGRVVDLYNGVTTSELGRVKNVDIINNTITVESESDLVYSASTPTYVRMTSVLLRKSKLMASGPIILGDSKIGGSFVPTATVFKAKYNNISGTAKKFRFMMEYLY